MKYKKGTNEVVWTLRDHETVTSLCSPSVCIVVLLLVVSKS